MTAWAHNRVGKNPIVGNKESQHSNEKLDPPRDWMDAFLLKRITADPNTSKVRDSAAVGTGRITGGSKFNCSEMPNNLGSCRHLNKMIKTFISSHVDEVHKLECLRELLELVKSAQERASRRFSPPSADTIDELSKTVRWNFRDLARYVTAHSGRKHLVFETYDNLKRGHDLISRFSRLP
jgi:hypothetical protein